MFSAIFEKFGVLFDAVQATLLTPTQDPARTLLVASMASILLLIIVLLALMLLEPRQRKVVQGSPLPDRRERRWRARGHGR